MRSRELAVQPAPGMEVAVPAAYLKIGWGAVIVGTLDS